jgi:hypothetical protein
MQCSLFIHIWIKGGLKVFEDYVSGSPETFVICSERPYPKSKQAYGEHKFALVLSVYTGFPIDVPT